MSGLEIALLVLAGLVGLLFLGGLAGARARERGQASHFAADVAAADGALTAARAADQGWDRAALDAAVRAALEAERPGVAFGELHLVLVDDRPGVEDDRAHYRAVPAAGGDPVPVVLVRGSAGWGHESVG